MVVIGQDDSLTDMVITSVWWSIFGADSAPAGAISWLMANHPKVEAGVSLPGPSGLLSGSLVEETKVPSIGESRNSLLPLPDKL